ncbi:MAG: hypothetical protein KDD58_05555 [Bdellovibrionales bacterium]|nr:hypothetical protein [Bdellovibrionales bacterium]
MKKINLKQLKTKIVTTNTFVIQPEKKVINLKKLVNVANYKTTFAI